ncbi:uncharacterized protein MONBRDRAFT_22493 [Monosiga brevicollis MX1]|uniref:Transcription initiation factor IIE subunit beta n=1 Tax=Monosiga brevicollis TaxID=81824 RepID=A9UQR5_MONBE|nr:uncharacterized protein MONBRDRAFT_22493 [Monosiga brevicollis MX1]EDQ93092.1 predicted protein [Monosiga brevicollis MX1]|eukprot:XP_001742854.1 hypothetical protein [Monosiga brevicollis MX1]
MAFVPSKRAKSADADLGVFMPLIIKAVTDYVSQSAEEELNYDDVIKAVRADVDEKGRPRPAEHMAKLREALEQPNRSVIVEGQRISYKAPYDVHDLDGLRRELRKFWESGLGGMRLDEIASCYKGAKADAQNLIARGEVYQVMRKQHPAVPVLFHRESSLELPMDPELLSRWRTIPMKPDHDIQTFLKQYKIEPVRVHIPPQVNTKTKKRKKKSGTKPRINK